MKPISSSFDETLVLFLLHQLLTFGRSGRTGYAEATTNVHHIWAIDSMPPPWGKILHFHALDLTLDYNLYRSINHQRYNLCQLSCKHTMEDWCENDKYKSSKLKRTHHNTSHPSLRQEFIWFNCCFHEVNPITTPHPRQQECLLFFETFPVLK